MAFESSNSTSPQDLLDKLISFCGTSGWTTIRTNGLAAAGNPGDQDTSGLQSSIHDPSVDLPGVERAQFNFVAYNTPALHAEIRICPSTGDSGVGAEFYAHTGTPSTSSRANQTAWGHGGREVTSSGQDLGFSGASTSYSFYSNTNTDGSRFVHGWVEGITDTFWHFSFGTVEKSGTYDGGTYLTATYIDGFETFYTPHQWDSSQQGLTISWVRMDNAMGSGDPGWRDYHGWAFDQDNTETFMGALHYGGQNSYNLRTPMAPIFVPFWDASQPSSQSGNWKFMGCLNDVRLISMDGLEPKQVITLGADTWDIIPAFRKGVEVGSNSYKRTGFDQTQSSNQMAYAYRRNV